MAYQIWTLHPVKPKRGEVRYRGRLVTYARGEEGSPGADAAHVADLVAIFESDGAEVLAAAVDGRPVIINDSTFWQLRAAPLTLRRLGA